MLHLTSCRGCIHDAEPHVEESEAAKHLRIPSVILIACMSCHSCRDNYRRTICDSANDRSGIMVFVLHVAPHMLDFRDSASQAVQLK